MKTTVFGCVALLVLLSSPAMSRTVGWTVNNSRGKAVNVSLPTAQAKHVKNMVGKLRASGVGWYANFWKVKDRASTRSYPKRNGVAFVAAVNQRNSEGWMREIGNKSIGLMCQGTPSNPVQTGEVRIGNLYFSYGSVNHGGSPTKMSRYFNGSSYGSKHCEYTIPVTSAELVAFKTFYLARANKAVVNRRGEPILPRFTADGATKYSRAGWVEGCSAAASSALDRHWTTAFKGSIQNIRAAGRRLNIPEMANATTEMATAIDSLRTKLGIKQQCSPQGMVRRGVFANNTRVGMMTILNDPNTNASTLKATNKWDQRYRDANGEAWSGMYPVTILPDLQNTGRGHKNFVNARVTNMDTLNGLFNQIPR